MQTSVLGYLMLGGFFALERVLREGDEARSLEATSGDGGTTRLIGAAYGLALALGLLAPLLSRLGWGRPPDTRLSRFGMLMMAVGIGVKAWAMRALGRFYTRTLRAEANQPVVESGPYRLVRHPGYLGALLLWIGFGLTVRNWLATLGISAAMLLAYARRISREEALLVRMLGAPYVAYQRRTWRLVPRVY